MRKPDEIRTAFAPTSSLDGLTNFFLVGIAGAGMSALARMLKKRGFDVRGSDMSASVESNRLQSEGISVQIGHSEEPIVNVATRPHALILTDAVNLEFSPEVAAARRLGIPIVRRSQALGWVLKPYKVIAVTGTHGKTTTTGMLGAGLIAAGLDPLVVVGASIPQWGGPIREGAGEYAVVEACEAYDSFHDLDPYLVLLTNLELDHIDFHENYDNLRSSVVRFANSIPKDGCLVFCAEDRGASEIAELTDAQTLGYGLSQTWLQQVSNKFGLAIRGDAHHKAKPTILSIPGEHNKLNASGALLAAAFLQSAGAKLDLDAVEQGIAFFHGAERRLQVLEDDDVVVIDDYAHHPTEVYASLSALRSRYFEDSPLGRRRGRLIVVFQPHLYSRTVGLVKEFAAALDLADEVVITDIYPAREAPQPGVSSALIAEQLTKPVHYIPSRHLLPRSVARLVHPEDVVVGMGAGNISEFAPNLIKELARRKELGWFSSSDSKATTPIRVAVLFGGDSAEREVSLHSGRAVGAALTKLGYEVTQVDVTDHLLGKGTLPVFTGALRPDVAFLAVHGTHAEDGALQGLLELLHIPYTGSGIQASAIAMDKGLTKKILAANGIRVPAGVLLDNPDQPCPVQTPLIVKPNAQGSTVGLSFVEQGGDVCHAIRKAFSYDTQVLVEEWVSGIEISTPVLNGEALLPVEIVPTGGRYDFERKYAPGATLEVVPARIGEELLKEAQEIALAAHRALGCAGATRTDAIVRGQEIFVLEVNTLPGMTATSLLPNSAAACGISFEQLCQKILEDALKRDAAKR
jgi:UDP-N-acetylmuramate--L-alanine ligase